MGVSNRWPSSNSELIPHMEMRLRTSVTRGYFFSSLTQLRRQPSVSIRKKYPLEPRVVIKWPSMCLRLDSFATRLDRVIRHFRSTANSKYRRRKNIRVYTAKLSGFKSFRIQSSLFRFRLQNLRRHDQTGEFLFRIRPLLRKRQNQSGIKTLRIHPKSGYPGPRGFLLYYLFYFEICDAKRWSKRKESLWSRSLRISLSCWLSTWQLSKMSFSFNQSQRRIGFTICWQGRVGQFSVIHK